MLDILKSSTEKLNRLRKEHLIKSSGSTDDGSWDKVRSGQSYLYLSQGMDSEVFEVHFKKNISGSNLTRALADAVTRFPYMNTRLVELDGDFYIVQNPVTMVAHPRKNLSKLGSIQTNEHLVEVTYHKRSAYFAFHHALCDGRGMKAFIETVIYYYCQYAYQSQSSADGIRLKGQELLEKETEDAFLDFYAVDTQQTRLFPNFLAMLLNCHKRNLVRT